MNAKITDIIISKHWQSNYAMTPNGPGHIFKMTEFRKIIDKADFLSPTDIVVFGEQSGGGSTFLFWLQRLLDDNKSHWMICSGRTWLPSLFKHHALASDEEKAAANDAMVAFAEGRSAAHSAEALVKWAQKIEKQCRDGSAFYLIIQGLFGIGADKAHSAANGLSIFREWKACPQLHIISISTNETLYLDDEYFSGYLRFCQCYRLPRLTKAETETLGQEICRSNKRTLKIAPTHLMDISDKTGGQPLLVKAFWQYYSEFLPDPGDKKTARLDLEKELIESAFKKLIKNPPSILSTWEKDLKKILKNNNNLIPLMKGYVAGKSRSKMNPPDDIERPLMIAGWVGFSYSERWGITSKFHAHFAKSVLDEL